MSARISETLRQLSPAIEQYSIDESFVEIPPGTDPTVLAGEMRRRVFRHVGIPVSIGLAANKVQAKLAAKLAKKAPELGGVSAFPTVAAAADALLDQTSVADVWGIAGRLAKRLERVGVTTARQLRDLPHEVTRRLLTVTGLRIALELDGFSCIALEEQPAKRQTIVRGRSFGRATEELSDVLEAVAAHTTRAGELLRRDNLTAGFLSVFIETSRFSEESPHYSNSCGAHFLPATDYTAELIRIAKMAAERIFRPGYRYQRAGVMLLELASRSERQLTFVDAPVKLGERRDRLMTAVDAINLSYGRDTVRSAATGFKREWKLRQAFPTPRFTTRWEELPLVHG